MVIGRFYDASQLRMLVGLKKNKVRCCFIAEAEPPVRKGMEKRKVGGRGK